MAISSPLDLKIKRSEPELIPPAKPTPYEFKTLSELDDQISLRKHNPIIQFYRCCAEMQGRDPAKVIKEAIAKALVYYYPLAGRLREGSNGKLIVECTGEGVLFIEADADVRLDQFGDVPQPPFSGAEDLLYDVPGSCGIVNCSMTLIQVTRFIGGGFIFAHRHPHIMSDGAGVCQFITAIGEMARGAHIPSIEPVWKRELLKARDPPRVSCLHHVYQEFHDSDYTDKDQFIQRSFFFSHEEIAGLRHHVRHNLRMYSKFDMLIACLWRCRTIALNLAFDSEVRVTFPVNARTKLISHLPVGYYGNAFVRQAAISIAGKLCHNPLDYALELIKRAKEDVTDEFCRSSIDLMVNKDCRPHLAHQRSFNVSDLSKIRFDNVDFGWGKAIYGGPMRVGKFGSYLVSAKNNQLKDGILVFTDLPRPAMERFAVEIKKMIRVTANFSSL